MNPPDETNEADEALLAELRAIARVVSPVPVDVVDAARAAYTWRTIDAELAELTFDSEAEPWGGVLVRGAAPTSRLLTFDAPDLTVGVEVSVLGDPRRLVGQLVPPGPGSLEVRHSGDPILVQADDLGRFSVDGVAPGQVS